MPTRSLRPEGCGQRPEEYDSNDYDQRHDHRELSMCALSSSDPFAQTHSARLARLIYKSEMAGTSGIAASCGFPGDSQRSFSQHTRHILGDIAVRY